MDTLAQLNQRIMDPAKVGRAVHADWTKLAVKRQVRNFIMAEFAGPWYSEFFVDPAARDDLTKRPTNFFKRLVDTYLPNLVGTEIHCTVTPKQTGLRGPAKLRELLLDHLCRVTNLARTHRLVLMDALLGGLGLYKVGIRAGTNIVKVSGEQYDIGQPYACRVDLDDFARDGDSRDPDEDTRRAFRYRVSKAFLLETGVFDNDVVENLPTLRNSSPTPGESHNISGGGDSGEDAIDDLVEVWDVIFYRGNKVLECSIPQLGTASGFLLKPREYEGPEGGPLFEMRLRDLPNNAHPVSISAQNLDYHLGESALTTKVMRRMLARCRKVFAKKEESDQAMELDNNMDDQVILGEWNGQQADLGGIDQGDIAALQQVTTWGNNETANIQQTGGNFDPNVKTATVGSIQQGNAMQKLGDLRALGTVTLNKVVGCFGWYLDNDPWLKRQFSMRVPGGDMVDVLYDAKKKKGNYSDFTYETQAVSEEPTDPRQKKAEFAQFMQWSIGWLGGVVQMGGNLEAAVRMLSTKYNTPELDEVFPTQAGMMDQAMQQYAAAQNPGPGNVVGMKPAGAAANAPPGKVRKPIDQRRADVAPAMAGAM